MEQNPVHVNGGDRTAPLANVGLCLQGLSRATRRPGHLPGMVCMYGPSGWGKSTAAAYVATRQDAYYVEAKSIWTKKAMLSAILREMGIVPSGTLNAMADQIAEQLALSGRPLILDEMDHVVDRGNVEMVRDLYESSGAAILLIGEEGLPGKLERFERFHGRVLDWIPAQPAGIEDAAKLRALYCDRVSVADDLLAMIVEVAHGSVRRICVNLEKVQDTALAIGVSEIDAEAWGGRELFSGKAPRRRT